MYLREIFCGPKEWHIQGVCTSCGYHRQTELVIDRAQQKIVHTLGSDVPMQLKEMNKRCVLHYTANFETTRDAASASVAAVNVCVCAVHDFGHNGHEHGRRQTMPNWMQVMKN